MQRILYFDNAATTYPKPQSVYSAAFRGARYLAGNPGRSGHDLSLGSAQAVYLCREKIARLFGADPEGVVFTLNATYAINIAIKSVLKKGDHVLISDIEHNSVFRPVAALAKRGYITYDVYQAYSDPQLLLASVKSKLRPNTALLCACHHSNICSLTLPLKELCGFCAENGIISLIDASQSAGSVPINMKSCKADILCAPAHKGLYGIMGCGIAVFSDRYDFGKITRTVIEGGNGVNSYDPFMPDFLPERFECGTQAVPAINALSSGIDFINSVGIENIAAHYKRLYTIAHDRLSSIDGVTVHGGDKGSILLFSVRNRPSEYIGELLNKYGICIRSGFHCSPLAHKKLMTPNGACRISFGVFNTEKQTLELCNTLRSIIK